MKLMACLAAGVAAIADLALANEAVWADRTVSGYWKNESSWVDGYKPSADGNDTVVMPATNGAVTVGAYIWVDEDAAVKGITYQQGTNKGGTASLAVQTGSTLTLGENGLSGTKATSTAERLPHIAGGGTIALAASQKWEFNYNGMVNTDWFSEINPNISGDEDVIWTLAGGKWRFVAGSSSNFLGRTYAQAKVTLANPEQFNRLGKEVTLCTTNCFGVTTTLDPAVNFWYRDVGAATGVVDTAIHLETVPGASKSISICIPKAYPAYPCTTIFRGAWTGYVDADKLSLDSSGDRYGLGVIASGGGINTPDGCVWRFENDMSDLIVTNKQGFSVQNAIIAVANDKTNGGKNGPKYHYLDKGVLTTAASGYRIGTGRSGRLQGLLSTTNAAVNCFIRLNSGKYTSRGTTLFGSTGPGYSEFNANIQIDGSSSTLGQEGELPFWLYAEPEGTCRITASFTYHNGGMRRLPVDIWGGGTVFIDCNQWTLSTEKHPFWVRDGHFVVGGTTADGGIGVQKIQVGVSHPQAFSVRVMEANYMSGLTLATYNSNTNRLVFSKAYTHDGVTVVSGDRVLVNNPAGESSYPGAIYNGIWEVSEDPLVWNRVEDFNEADELLPDTRVDVAEGKTFAGTRWFLNYENYRVRQNYSAAQSFTFLSHDDVISFLPERNKNPEVAFLIAYNRTQTNSVTVVDNQSTGDSILGGYTTNSTTAFTGPIVIAKDRLAVTAPSGAVCSFKGTMSGTVELKKTGAGEVVIMPADENLVVTNLVMAEGTLQVTNTCLSAELDHVELPFKSGATATLSLNGDVDLSGWTFDFTGLYKPARTETIEPFAFTVVTTGSVTGEPSVRLNGTSTRRWMLTHTGNTWSVRYAREGLNVILK